jgi:hypothetical protein
MRESEETPGENVTFLKRCWTCDEPHIRSGRTCSRECLSILAGFEDFTTLHSTLINARWAGAPSQEELRGEYFRGRMRYGVRRLVDSEDALSAVLIEIVEEMESERRHERG